MATWTAIGDTFLEPGKPVRSVDGLALRDNPIAIAEGAAGAPKVETLGLIESERMTTDNVLGEIASLSSNSVGSFAFLRNDSGSTIYHGATLAGSSLYFVSAAGNPGVSPKQPSGTWRCLGYAAPNNGPNDASRSTLWVRIS